MLLGPSTKPVYVIDLNVDFADELGRAVGKGTSAERPTPTPDAEPPVDHLRHPDALAFLSFSKHKAKQTGWINAYVFTLAPIQGEFTRKDGLPDGCDNGKVQVDFKPLGKLNIYPIAGHDVGHAVKKPSQISDQDIDLSDWKVILRGVLGVTGEWTLLYTGRFLAHPEPSVKPGVVDGQRAAVTTVSKDMRHHAEPRSTGIF